MTGEEQNLEIAERSRWLTAGNHSLLHAEKHRSVSVESNSLVSDEKDSFLAAGWCCLAQGHQRRSTPSMHLAWQNGRWCGHSQIG